MSIELSSDIAVTHSDSDSSLPTVLTVPTSYGQKQREMLEKCAEKAGFEVLQV